MTNLWKALESIKDQRWVAFPTGTIRNQKYQCPLCALADHLAQHPLGYQGAFDLALKAAKVDYHEDEAQSIVTAADDYTGEDRQRLEEILNPIQGTWAQYPIQTTL